MQHCKTWPFPPFPNPLDSGQKRPPFNPNNTAMNLTRHIPITVFLAALLLSTASCDHQPPPAPAVAYQGTTK